MNHKTEFFTDMMTIRPLFLDTETTGLGRDAEVCQIAIVDYDGDVLLDTLVHPTRPIPPDATAIHHITNAMVVAAPTFAEIMPTLYGLLDCRNVVIYNADYDVRVLHQSARAHGLPFEPRAKFHCAMIAYAEFHGEWDDYRGSYRWIKLGNALYSQGIDATGVVLHTAMADAEMTRRLVRKIAGDLE